MTNPDHHNEDNPGEESSGAGAIIDATAGPRSRVQTPRDIDKRQAPAEISFLGEIPLHVNVVLGETRMPLGEILGLETDSIIQLDKPSGDPVDIYVEDQQLGRGEVIVLHEKLRIRVLEVIPPTSGETKKPERK